MQNAGSASQPPMMNDLSNRGGNAYSAQPIGGQPLFPQQSQQQSSMPPPNNPSANSDLPFPATGPNASSSQASYRPGDSNSIQGVPSALGNDFSPNAIASGDSGGQGTNQASSSARRNDPEWQKARHKQQRLLLLRHASHCQYEGRCPVTPHCASMKKLWEHIVHCRNQQCQVPHCMSSRYVLNHYRRCKDARCPACNSP
jgi:E1A/CREB-binding protein